MRESALSAYFGVTPRLLPHMAPLLTGFDELGSHPALVVNWLREWCREGPLRVLELGCGKGAVSVRLARELGARVEGIDLYARFIRGGSGARNAVLRGGEAVRVHRRRPSQPCPDRGIPRCGAVSLGVRRTGDPAECIALLRRCVRRGDVIVLQDAWTLCGEHDFPGYEHIVTREETLAQLTACGDRILPEHTIPAEAMPAQDSRYMSSIQRRARELCTRGPQLNEDLDGFLQKERDENLLLEIKLQRVTWMIEWASG